mmetsp:Transcript_55141/g.124134  ORF Transcript_55141/g.124134 Transcript_55141/m.124134 type:complete len:276 (-) Transcript_55141:2060-2887(-)
MKMTAKTTSAVRMAMVNGFRGSDSGVSIIMQSVDRRMHTKMILSNTEVGEPFVLKVRMKFMAFRMGLSSLKMNHAYPLGHFCLFAFLGFLIDFKLVSSGSDSMECFCRFFSTGSKLSCGDDGIWPGKSPLMGDTTLASFIRWTAVQVSSSSSSGCTSSRWTWLILAFTVPYRLRMLLPELFALRIELALFTRSSSSNCSWMSPNFEISILRKRLRKRICPKRIMNMKRMADSKVGGTRVPSQRSEARMPAYMIVFQFSPVMTWKTVTNPQMNVSK